MALKISATGISVVTLQDEKTVAEMNAYPVGFLTGQKNTSTPGQHPGSADWIWHAALAPNSTILEHIKPAVPAGGQTYTSASSRNVTLHEYKQGATVTTTVPNTIALGNDDRDGRYSAWVMFAAEFDFSNAASPIWRDLWNRQSAKLQGLNDWTLADLAKLIAHLGLVAK